MNCRLGDVPGGLDIAGEEGVKFFGMLVVQIDGILPVPIAELYVWVASDSSKSSTSTVRRAMRRFLFLAVCKAGGALYKKPAGLSIDWLPDTWCFLRRCLRGVIMGPSSRWEIFGRKVQHGWGASALALSGSSERTEWSGDSPLDDSFSARLESEGGGG